MTALVVVGAALAIVFVAVVLGIAMYNLGLNEGEKAAQFEIAEVRDQAERANRQLFDLTRQAFIAMAEEAERARS